MSHQQILHSTLAIKSHEQEAEKGGEGRAYWFLTKRKGKERGWQPYKKKVFEGEKVGSCREEKRKKEKLIFWQKERIAESEVGVK